MQSELQTDREHMQMLKRRVDYLRKRIAAREELPYAGTLAFDRGEAAAIDWAICELAKVKPELYKAAFDPPAIEKMAQRLQKRFAAAAGGR